MATYPHGKPLTESDIAHCWQIAQRLGIDFPKLASTLRLTNGQLAELSERQRQHAEKQNPSD